MKRTIRFASFAVALAFGLGLAGTPALRGQDATTAASVVPRLIKFSGVLTSPGTQNRISSASAPVINATFSLYEFQEGGSPLWSESQQVQLDGQSRYVVLLGATDPAGLPLDLFTSGKALWLGVQPQLSGAGELPRVLLVAVPYALKASDSDTLGGKPASAYALAGTPTLLELAGGAALPSASPNKVQPDIQTVNKDSSLQPLTPCAAVTSNGAATINTLAKFTAACTIQNSLLRDNGTGVAVGGTASPGALFDVQFTSTAATGALLGQRVLTTLNPAAASSASTNGFFANALTQSGNAQNFTGKIFALNSELDHYGTGTLSNGYGMNGTLINKAAGTITNAYGINASLSNASTGHITNGYGVYVNAPSNATGGTFSNFSGLYIANPSAVAGAYGLYSAGGKNYFAGNVGIATTTPTANLEVNGTAKFDGFITFKSGQTFPIPAAGVTDAMLASPYSGVGTCTSGKVVSALTRNAAPTCVTMSTGTVTSVASGSGLTGGPITGSGTLSIATGGVTNAMLAHPSLTVTAGSGLSGGGLVALGNTTTLSVNPNISLTTGTFSGSNASEIVSVTQTGSGMAVLGANSATGSLGQLGTLVGGFSTGVYGSGSTYGLYGSTSGSHGVHGVGGNVGVYGTGNTYGVAGFTTGSGTNGVYGSGDIGVYGTGTTYGVGGYSTGSGIGVYGSNTTGGGYGQLGATVAANGDTGVYGSGSALGVAGTNSTGGSSGELGAGVNVYGDTGVRGNGSYAGVFGNTTGSGIGVYGINNTGNSYGELGATVSSNGDTGVYGSGSLAGVYGDGSDYGVVGKGSYGGVEGSNAANTAGGIVGTTYVGDGNPAGVVGYNSGTGFGYGVVGTGYNSGSIGILGTSSATDSIGVWGDSTGGSGSYGVLGSDSGTGTYAVYAQGNLGYSGAISSVVAAADNRVLEVYGMGSPENWFEDFGTGQLSAGAGVITLDSSFAQTVNTEAGYHVFLTPNGECEGLYVAQRTATGFQVRELHSGKSNITFDYRIVAKRRGYENVRLEQLVADPETAQRIRAVVLNRPAQRILILPKPAGPSRAMAELPKFRPHPAAPPAMMLKPLAPRNPLAPPGPPKAAPPSAKPAVVTPKPPAAVMLPASPNSHQK